MSQIHRHLTFVLASVMLVSLPATMSGCLVAQSKGVAYTGTRVEHSDLSKVRLNQTTTTEVERLLGLPSTTDSNDDGTETWTWKWRKTTAGEGHVLLLFAGAKVTTVDESVTIRFRDGVAVEKWRG